MWLIVKVVKVTLTTKEYHHLTHGFNLRQRQLEQKIVYLNSPTAVYIYNIQQTPRKNSNLLDALYWSLRENSRVTKIHYGNCSSHQNTSKWKINQNYLIVVIKKIINIRFGVGIKEVFKQQIYIDFFFYTLECDV